MKSILLPILLATTLHVALAQSASSKSVPTNGPARADDPLTNQTCSTFRWVANGTQEHYALEVPVDLNGQSYWFQLDTGSPDTMLYGNEAVQKHWASADSRFFRAQAFQTGGATLSSVVLWENKDMPAGKGTL